MKVGIIGAGAAGLVAAGAASQAGADVVVFERNPVVGKKLAITGKGRCNVTNTADRDEFMRNLPGNGQFLFSCFARFGVQETIDLFESLGVSLKVERGGRVFPESDDADQIVDALFRYAQDNGAKILTSSRVQSVSLTSSADTDGRGADDSGLVPEERPDVKDGVDERISEVRKVPVEKESDVLEASNVSRVSVVQKASDVSRTPQDLEKKLQFEVRLETGRRFFFDSVVIATGGASYPGTGSTGDGYNIATSFGHTVVNPSPALVPLVSPAAWVKEAQGLSLRNVTARLEKGGKVLQSEFGEMLFTHFGVSGPIILTLSRKVTEELRRGRKASDIVLIIDLKPALSHEQLDERIKRDFSAVSRKMFKNSLDELLPKKLIDPLIELSEIPPDKPVNQITREERQNLVELVKGLLVPISGTRPLNEAIITAGGVTVKEIDPRTMESKLVPGLYFAGEVIDVDGYTGGYNLQAAWSTGYVAGVSAAQS